MINDRRETRSDGVRPMPRTVELGIGPINCGDTKNEFDRVIDTYQIIHATKNTRPRTTVTKSQKHNMLKSHGAVDAPNGIRKNIKQYLPARVTNAVRSTCSSTTGSCQKALWKSVREMNRAWPTASRQDSRPGIGQVLRMMWRLRVWR